jgi:NitT/TauT family transport system permease protein/taurine transport system permease protein
LLSFALFVLCWWIFSSIIVSANLIPSPEAVVVRGVQMFEDGKLVPGIVASLTRVAVGLVLGVLGGILIGLLIGRLRLAAALVDPIVQLLRNLSPTAMTPIALVWFGIGESSKYFLIFWGSFFIVAVNTIAGVASVPGTRVRAAQCLGATELRIFTSVILPSSLPYVVAGVRLAVASAFMTIIPAEMLAAQVGLGALLQQASITGQVDRMFVVLAIIAVLGYATDRGVRYVAEHPLRRYTQFQGQM